MTDLTGWWGVFGQARNKVTGELMEGSLVAVVEHHRCAVALSSLIVSPEEPLVRPIKGSVEIVRAHIEEAALEIERLAEERADG